MDLNQVTIYSHDVRRLVDFYKLLGLRLIVDSIPRYARFECPDGASTFSLHETQEARVASNIVLYFECDDLDAVVNELRSKGVQFTEGPTDREWLWREASLRDPDGNRLILYKASSNRKHPPWRVESD
jgi:predicted enzyme related to lactoylglutathione lyase